MSEPKVSPPQWVIDQQRQQQGQQIMRPRAINPRNYLRPDPRRAKVIDLNQMMSTWGAGQAKYKEGDLFISKKILQNLEESKEFGGITCQEKFVKNLKTIDDIISGPKGEISYKFRGLEGFLEEAVLDQNYIHHYKTQAWKYYLEKTKTEKTETAKPNTKKTAAKKTTVKKAAAKKTTAKKTKTKKKKK